MTAPDTNPENRTAGFGGGAIIGARGGPIGLGGAEFCLPMLIGAFQFGALEAPPRVTSCDCLVI